MVRSKSKTKHKVETRTIFLDANNEAWCKVKHMSMRTALLFVSDSIERLMASGQLLAAGKLKKLTFDEFRDRVKLYPIQKKKTDSYGGLSYLLNETLAHYTVELVQVEQYLAAKLMTSATQSDWSVLVELLQLNQSHQLNRFIFQPPPNLTL